MCLNIAFKMMVLGRQQGIDPFAFMSNVSPAVIDLHPLSHHD
jgi:hypothetical protein